MEARSARHELATVVEASGLVPGGSRGVVLVSGGADSACAAAGLAELCGAGNIFALTLNYGLRDSSNRDEEAARELCERLGIELLVERPQLGEGNVQDAARAARYAAAERLRARRGGEWIATGHSRTDLAETLIYRLAVSPGTRPLRGLPPCRGRIIRPLLELERAELRRLAGAAELPFVDDPTNEERAYARNRIRADVLPVLRELSPAAERNIAETRAELVEEAAVLERVAEDALAGAGAGQGADAVRVEALESLEPGLRRLALRTLAERAAAREVVLGSERVGEIIRLARHPEGGEVDLGGGVRALCEQGFIRFSLRDAAEPPAPAALAIPGTCRFGHWELRAELRPAPVDPGGPERATLDAVRLGEAATVRSWHEGDRIRPLGMEGTKSLQDLFTDHRVPRSIRRTLPVVEARGAIAWVAGVAVSEEFKLTEETDEVVVLSASQLKRPPAAG